MLSAAEMIQLLDLRPHPEGGHFRETWRDSCLVDGNRAASTAIYFLLGPGERTHWHRVGAAEAGTTMPAHRCGSKSRPATAARSIT